MGSKRRIRVIGAIVTAVLMAANIPSVYAGNSAWTIAGTPALGSVLSLAVDHTDRVLFAGTETQVWKSTDRGLTWTQLTNHTTGTGLSGGVNAIAVAPATVVTPRAIYIGTAKGVGKSTDDGVTWTNINGVVTVNPATNALAIAPSNPNIIYRGGANGFANIGGGVSSSVWRSTDAGATWSAFNANGLATDNVNSIAVHPTNPDIAYVTMANTGVGIFKTVNGGNSTNAWVQKNTGLIQGNNDYLTYGIAIDPSAPNTLYLGTRGTDQMFKSTNAGDTWTVANTGLTGTIANALLVDPEDGTVYAGFNSLGVYRSSNGATSWTAMNDSLPTGSARNVNNNAVLLSEGISHEGILYIGTGGGVYSFTFAAPVVVIDDTLSLSEDLSQHGHIASVGIELDITHHVDFVELTVSADDALAHLVGVTNILPGFVSHEQHQGNQVHIEFGSRTEEGFSPGHYTLGRLIYDVNASAIRGTTISVSIPAHSDIFIAQGDTLPHLTFGGGIHLVRPGDVNHDGAIDVLDVIALVNVVLGKSPFPAAETNNFIAADVNADHGIDLLDVVRTLNVALGRASAKPITGPSSPVRMELGTAMQADGGQILVPVRANFDGAVAGLQLTLTYDPATMRVGEPIPTANLDGVRIERFTKHGTVKLLLFSTEGRVFRAGTLLNVPIELLGMTTAGTLTISQVVVANAQAQGVPAVIATGTVKVSALPTAYSLGSNKPNPFNPSTQIAYEVPQQAHVTLTVYNILGQELVRLVDESKAPGRYTVMWNGRTTQGVSVASGVYLYRLTSGTGFTQTRRMTLLK